MIRILVMKAVGNAAKQAMARWAKTRVENSHLPFRRGEHQRINRAESKIDTTGAHTADPGAQPCGHRIWVWVKVKTKGVGPGSDLHTGVYRELDCEAWLSYDESYVTEDRVDHMFHPRITTALAIALAVTVATPVIGSAQGATAQIVIMKNGMSQAVTRTVEGFDVTGTYGSIDNGEAMVVLNADGSGNWRGDNGEAMRQIHWWIAADASGKALAQAAPNGQALTLIVDFGGGDFSGWELAISNSPRQMYINRDRVKPY